MDKYMEWQMLKFLEYLAGACKYRRYTEMLDRFSKDVFFGIPLDLYEFNRGRIRLTDAGWDELIRLGHGNLKDIRHAGALIKTGRVTHDLTRNEFRWVKPVYLSNSD